MGGYAFGTRPGIDAFALAQALGVSMPGARAVSSPRVSSEGTFTTGPGETGSVGPAIGQGTASAEAQGVAGRSALAADLASTMGVANNALSLMGLLGGPLANIAQQGLKAAMTAHNAVALAQAFESLTPAQRSALTVDQQFALAQPQLGPLGPLVSFFTGPLAIADPLGQKESVAFQAQRAGERSLTPNDPVDVTAPPAVPEGISAADAVGGNPAGPGGPPGSGETGGGTDAASLDKGGYVKRRMLASLKGGEFVIRPEMVPGHRKLLEQINRGR